MTVTIGGHEDTNVTLNLDQPDLHHVELAATPVGVRVDELGYEHEKRIGHTDP